MCVLVTLNKLHFFKFMCTLKVYSFKSKQTLVTTNITKRSLRCKIKYVLYVFSKTKRKKERKRKKNYQSHYIWNTILVLISYDRSTP